PGPGRLFEFDLVAHRVVLRFEMSLCRSARSSGFAARAQVGQHDVDAFLVDEAQRRVAHAQPDPPVLALDPEAAALQVRQETTLRLVVRVRDVVADHRRLTGNLTDSGHGGWCPG